MRSETFVLGLKLVGKLCLVVGGGEEAERRALAFLAAGGYVRVVSDDPTPELVRLGAEGTVVLARRRFEEQDLDGVWLAVSTDPDPVLSTELLRLTEARKIFFSALDQPEQSSYSHLAIARSGPVSVAVSTNGRAPALARRLREELERLFRAANLGAFADELATLRERTASPDRRSVLGNAVRGVRFDGRLALRATDIPAGNDNGAPGS